MCNSSPQPHLDAEHPSESRFLLSHLLPSAVSAYPDRPALRCAGTELSYRDLDVRVGQLAAALHSVGVKPGDRVGIHLHMSVESYVAVHAVLRVGAAYVPLDALAPVTVLATIADDCAIEVVITHDPRRLSAAELATQSATVNTLVGLTDTTIAGPEATVISWRDVAGHVPINPAPVLADDLAYVMYTSGSTGTPKGIMHTHRSGLAYAELSAATYAITATDRLANFAPLHFDISTFALFVGPATGACVTLLPEPYLKMPASLTAHLAEEACTVLYTVPSIYLHMLRRGAASEKNFDSVRWMKFGGEVLPPVVASELLDVFPNATLSNVYGPAEVNQCTFHHFDSPPKVDGEIPIGRSWANTEVRLVRADGQRALADPTTGHTVGELVVRTATMMQGYWNRPDLDAGAFDHELVAGGRKQTWYRTGDLVEAKADGTLVFLGRRDHQVKVRGNRIELESIESALGDLPEVEQAVAGVRRGDDGADELVASVVLAPGAALDVADMRQRLAERLAPYAIPTDIVHVDDFARTPSGKIDRRAARSELQNTRTLENQISGVAT